MNREHIMIQFLLRAWPFPRGAGRIIDKLFSKINSRKRLPKSRPRKRFTMTVAPNDLIGRHIYLTGEFDRTTVEVLCNFAQPGDTLLDIGANIGYVSGCFLAKVPRSRVICVEPQPVIVDLLKTNMKQFPDRYKIAAFALSDHDDEGSMEIRSGNPGASRIVEESDANTVTIEIQSADRFFRDLNLNRLTW